MKIIITDQYKIEYLRTYDFIFLFNNRENLKSKKILSIANLLESETILKKKDLNAYVNNQSNKFLKLNKHLLKSQFYSVIIKSMIFEKNPFKSNFYFTLYQYIIFKKVFTKYKRKKAIVHHNLNCKVLSSFFFNQYFLVKIINNFIKIIFSYVQGIKYHFFNNFSLKIFIKKRYEKKKKFLFVDHYANLNFSNGNSKIWNDLKFEIKKNEYDFLAVNFFKKENYNFKNNFYILQQFNNLISFFVTFYIYTIIYFKIIFLTKFGNEVNNENFILFNFFKYNLIGSSLIKNINDYKLFKYFFLKYSYKKIFITHENQPWETICTNSLKLINNESLVYYYIHTPIRYWDIRYDFDIYNHMNSNSSPNYICFSTRNCLSEYEDLKKNIHFKLVYSLRYKHLKYYNFKQPNNFTINKNSFVLIGDIVKNSTNNLLDLLDSYARDIGKKINIYVKFHSSNVLDTKKFINISIIKIYKLSKNMNYVYLFPNYTTASIDYYHQDKICLSFLDKLNFNLSPLIKNQKYSYFFYDKHSFKTILNNLKDYKINKNKHKFIFNEKFYNWKKIL